MAETRTIRTVLELNAQRFTAGAAQASASAKSLAGELGKIGDASGKQRANYDRVANSLLGVGTAAAAGLGLAAKASMDWESAWTGVLKTVDGTDAELAAVEEGLRGLTKVLPASHTEIAAVAEAAGQLGVQTGSVVEFTETMINLGETTNLSAEEAATGLARFSNIMGTSQDDVDRLGAAIVGLGNNYETTESEILAMSMRLSGIGSQLSMSEGDVLGLAAAMSSVGIEAEAGGTAMTMGMKKIDKAVREGGDSLAGFAEVAGMSNDEFSKLWSEDSTAGLEAFVHGLARVGEEGGSVSGTLDELGMKGIRESDTFLRLASNAEGMSEALAQGNTEFERNLALTEEAAKFYATTESQIAIAKNSLIDAGIEIGASVLPVLADAASSVSDLATWFAALPAPVQGAVTQLGAIVGVTGLVAGGLVKLVPGAIATVDAFKSIRDTSPQTASALGKVGKAAGIAAVAFTAATALSSYGNSLNDITIGANEAAAAAMKLADGTDPIATLFDGMSTGADASSASTKELAADLDVLANGHWYEGLSNVETGLRNVFGAGLDTTDDIRQRIGEIGQGIAGLAQTDLPSAQAAFENLWTSFGGSEEAGLNLLELMPELKNELAGVANAAGLDATDSMVLLGLATGDLVPVVDEATDAVTGYNTAQGEAEGATDETTGAVQEQVDALTGLQEQLEGTANLLLGSRGAMRDFEAAIDDAAAAAEKNGKTLDRNTEAGRENEAALDGIVQKAHAAADAQLELNGSAEEADAVMTRAREKFIETAEAMDMSREEAEALADQLGLIPQFVEARVEVEVDPDGKVPEFTGILSDIPPATNTTVDVETGESVQKMYGFGEVVEGATEDRTVTVDGDVQPAWNEMNLLEAAINDAGGTVTINGDSVPGDQVLDTLLGIINSSDGTVTINGFPVPAEEALMQAIRLINSSGGTVDIDGDNSGANAATDSAKRKADGTTGTIDVDANTSRANSDINNAARDRTSRIRVSVSYSDPGFSGAGMSRGFANGGWLNEGLSSGGWVPGSYPGPGIDNVMWPMAGKAGGGMLTQPLAGTEYVVNGASAQQWGPALEAINAGMQPAQAVQNVSASVDSGAIASAVAGAMSGWQPVVKLGNRDFYGQMVQSERAMGGRRG